MCSDHIHPLPPTLPRSNQFPTHQALCLKKTETKTNIKTNVCCPNILECVAFHINYG